MTRFDKYLKTMLDQAAAEARLDGSATVEAQHLLLAIAADHDSAPGRVLVSAGLDKDAIRAALDREFDRSLGAAGVARSAFGGLPRHARPARVCRTRALRSGSLWSAASAAQPGPTRNRRTCYSGSCRRRWGPCRGPSPWPGSTAPT